MATAASVLGVLRAARPAFRSAHDRVSFVVHSAFLASGYSLTAVGSAAGATFPSSAASATEETEVGIEGWNELDGSYAFQYSDGSQAGLCKSVIVKCTAIGDLLMVDAAPLSDADTPYSLEIKVNDYTVDSMTSNYGQQYTNLEGLVDRLNSSIISKLSSSAGETSSDTKSPSAQPEREREVRPPPRISILEDPPRPGGFQYPEIPAYGGNDLLPGLGAGIFAPRRDVGVGVGGTMLVGPNDPRWGRVGIGGQPPVGGPNPPGVPPGARFDPFGPPGVPGFEPNRFIMDPRRPPGGSHPDLEHFSPF
ncbi:proteasome inhibitor subunit 1 (PI31) [Marchantia polymorpha subsp. ruderalis]